MTKGARKFRALFVFRQFYSPLYEEEELFYLDK